MKLNSSIQYLRNATLVLGALAVVPLSAQAMLTKHDVQTLQSGTSVAVDKEVSGIKDDVLARRFGAYSGIGANGSGLSGSSQATDQPSAGSATTIDERSDEVFMRAP